MLPQHDTVLWRQDVVRGARPHVAIDRSQFKIILRLIEYFTRTGRRLCQGILLPIDSLQKSHRRPIVRRD